MENSEGQHTMYKYSLYNNKYSSLQEQNDELFNEWWQPNRAVIWKK